jgi:hypothetical protein
MSWIYLRRRNGGLHAFGSGQLGSCLTDATHEGRSRCIVRVFAAMLQPKRDAVAIVAAICAGGVIETSMP